ncbi:MAG: indole-3-glycerol phosphate synthase TrpC [Acidobacteria bacterium]|nr:indole-3-glycerol phosphate synthase TrpC [Acidobacteriota bacterium]MCI0567279.1 indole-3-glycerol phosphate synthase TrpC [Acidobacteriota bacterium]
MIVSGILAEILQSKRREIEALSTPEGRRRIDAQLREAPAPRDFRAALGRGPGFRIIAEMKKASPSRGVLLQQFDPGRLAREYESGGAAALSVLTDAAYFQGCLADLAQARDAASLPVLRKDFVLDESQVEESRGWGADAVLLIAAALETPALGRLMQRVTSLGMNALVEVHDEQDLSRALDAGASVVGVNNRNLGTFQASLKVSLELAGKITPGILRVSESGLSSRADLELLSGAGYDAFLIGESLMSAEDRTARLREWAG